MIEYTFYFFKKQSPWGSGGAEVTVTTNNGVETARDIANWRPTTLSLNKNNPMPTPTMREKMKNWFRGFALFYDCDRCLEPVPEKKAHKIGHGFILCDRCFNVRRFDNDVPIL